MKILRVTIAPYSAKVWRGLEVGRWYAKALMTDSNAKCMAGDCSIEELETPTAVDVPSLLQVALETERLGVSGGWLPETDEERELASYCATVNPKLIHAIRVSPLGQKQYIITWAGRVKLFESRVEV